jgi:hypothetical protein
MDSTTTFTNAPEAPGTREQRAKLIGGLLLVVLGLFVVYLGSTDVRRLWTLRSATTHVQATVTGTRLDTNPKQHSHFQLRYRFRMHGHTYTYTDATGRRNLWVSMQHGAWRTAGKSGVVDVVYSARDPWINQPEHAGGFPWGDTLAGLVLGVIILGFGMKLALGARRAANTLA